MEDLVACTVEASRPEDFGDRPSAPPAAAPTVLYGGPRPSDPLFNSKDKNKCRVRYRSASRPLLVK